MPYTWTGASTLGFDLVRRAAGPHVAAVLTAALSADPAYARALADQPAPSRSLRLDALGRAEAAAGITVLDLRELRDLPPDADLGTRVRVLRERLRAQRFGGPGDLVDLVERDGLTHLNDQVPVDVLERAAQRLSDAVLAALLWHVGDDGEARAAALPLTAAYAACRRPELFDLGPYPADVQDLLDGIRNGGRRDPYALLSRPIDAGVAWASAMHAASWAVELTGRTRASATAQMLCVRALADAGITVDECAAGAWNAASGLVLARVVADVLPDEELAVLVPPLP
jgi:hypothetical protein